MASLSPPSFIVSLLLIILTILNQSSSASLCNANDKQVLLTIKSHFNKVSTFESWNSSTDCCSSWLWTGVECNTLGRVTGFVVRYDNLPKIPDELLQLKYLTKIDLSGNGIRDNIPTWLSKLTKLTYIDLSDNQLTGSIPATLGYVKSLQYLYLHRNNLSGKIPATLAYLDNLTYLGLWNNQLTGSVPASFAAFKNPALEIDLFRNKLSGPIPVAWGKLNISGINLSINRFTGDASFLFGRDKTMLKTIALNDNKFRFDFSKVALSPGIKYLDISNNMIYGSLPKELGQLPLSALYVSNNQLCGQIPTGRRLKQFDPNVFSNNKCLCGVPLPPCK